MKQHLRCNSNFSYRFAFTTNFQKCCYFSFSSVAFFRSPFYNCLNRIFILFRILMPRKRIETGGVSYREVFSPYLEEKLPWGLVPYVQALLLARYIREDLDAYPPFLWK